LCGWKRNQPRRKRRPGNRPAAALSDRWPAAALDEQLSALGPLKTNAEGALAQLDALNARTAKHQQRLDHLKNAGNCQAE